VESDAIDASSFAFGSFFEMLWLLNAEIVSRATNPSPNKPEDSPGLVAGQTTPQ
jgi:hypothetical protein